MCALVAFPSFTTSFFLPLLQHSPLLRSLPHMDHSTHLFPILCPHPDRLLYASTYTPTDCSFPFCFHRPSHKWKM